jgi:hypothetical protein
MSNPQNPTLFSLSTGTSKDALMTMHLWYLTKLTTCQHPGSSYTWLASCCYSACCGDPAAVSSIPVPVSVAGPAKKNHKTSLHQQTYHSNMGKIKNTTQY